MWVFQYVAILTLEPLLLLLLSSAPTPPLSDTTDLARRNQSVKLPCREPGDHDHSWTINTPGPSLSSRVTDTHYIFLYLKLESIKPLLKNVHILFFQLPKPILLVVIIAKARYLLTRNGIVMATITKYRNFSSDSLQNRKLNKDLDNFLTWSV